MMSDGKQTSALAQPLRPPSIGRTAACLACSCSVRCRAAGALVQSGWFPGGLLLALVGAAGVFVGGGKAIGTRAGAVAPAAGWVVAVILLTASRPEGTSCSVPASDRISSCSAEWPSL